MLEVFVIAEGETEEKFINLVLKPVFCSSQIYLKPKTLDGNVKFSRFKFHAVQLLKQHKNAVITSFVDLYGIGNDFPEFNHAKQEPDMYKRLEIMETALSKTIIDVAGCRPERFIPYIQPYEFEGLLFSDVDALVQVEPFWSKHKTTLQKIRNDFPSPEHINDSYETAPSKRLENALNPKYKKTLHGPLIAEQITLTTMERECLHFKNWLDKLRCLS